MLASLSASQSVSVFQHLLPIDLILAKVSLDAVPVAFPERCKSETT